MLFSQSAYYEACMQFAIFVLSVIFSQMCFFGEKLATFAKNEYFCMRRNRGFQAWFFAKAGKWEKWFYHLRNFSRLQLSGNQRCECSGRAAIPTFDVKK